MPSTSTLPRTKVSELYTFTLSDDPEFSPFDGALLSCWLVNRNGTHPSHRMRVRLPNCSYGTSPYRPSRWYSQVAPYMRS